jgi:hypothetical protein
MSNLQSQYRQIRKAAELDLVLVDTEALNIFASCGHAGTLEERVATVNRNLIHYYCHCLEREAAPEMYLKLIRQHSRQTDDGFAKQLPPPPKSLPEKFHCIYQIIQKVQDIRNLLDDQACARLYELAAHWANMLQSAPMQPIPASMIMDNAIKYCYQYHKRHENVLANYIRWGEEYDSCLQKYLSLGYRPKTAKTMAKQDFIKTHPLPKNADEQLETGELPGHSNPALRRYHKAYLNSKP